jgi:hypothetical protein
MSEKIIIRPATKNDKKIIILSVSKIFRFEVKPLELIWEWLFVNNPYIEGDYSDGWVMEKNNKIIGSISFFPQLFNLNGKNKLLVFGSFLFISKEFRQPLNTYSFLNRFIKENNDYLFVGNTPINGITDLFKPFGSYTIKDYNNKNCYYLIRSDKVLIEWCNEKKFSNIGKSIIRIFIPFIKIVDIIRNKYLLTNKTYQFSKCNHINEEFDILWEKLKNSYNILGVRNKKYLIWRYLKHPLGNIFLFSIRKNGLLVGYLAYSIRKRKNSDLMIFEVLDIFCDHTNSQLVKSISYWIIQKAKKTKSDIIKVSFMPKKLRDELLKCGFINSSTPNLDFIIFKNNSHYLDNYYCNENKWYLSSSDGDYTLGL